MRKVALLTMVVLSGCQGAEQPPTVTDQTPVMTSDVHHAVALTDEQQQGRLIFETVCWTCHGPAGRGDGPAVQAGSMSAPPTFQTEEYATASAAMLARRFQIGLTGADPAHPHMQYVSSILKEETFSAALSYIPAIAYPPEIPGSAINGERLFQFRCAGCHGPGGHGDGPGADNLVDIKPVDFTSDTLIAARDWDALHGRIREGGRTVHGSAMPAWGIVLSDPDIWDLVAYLATFQPGAVRRPTWSR